ncbi:HPt (histidine-containing phosphotransfer) domain-containing protein [Flexibacter flexilis DSM 6793]|uniref:HPt (Histidine-containing phosphotransfer) domain-containing protein n=1 Tax=Flexibacter flexilis DSM 6793 TaxID=927664 RepID=A0A1I1JMS3_9BACT|nr:Hpt domain-containing protein [Flexibacter flexilis]SFC49844.1 HPt (histidine-containing phosphotransfer) domain-containing protein [Flexibacter flexilis DSM 6793]
MANTQYINLNYLQDISGGDEEFVRDLLETFVSNSPQDIQIITDALAAHQWDTIWKMGHKLKSSSKFMGAEHMAEAAAEIECYCKQVDKIEIPHIQILIKNLEQQFALAQTEIQGLL